MKIFFLVSFLMQMQLMPVQRQALLFYTEAGKDVWVKQKEEFTSHEQGITERDILVKSLHIGSTKNVILKDWNIDPTKNFTFILVGRDGGEKFRSNKFVTADQLFALIDAMPMRKNEMRKSKGSHD